MVDPALPPPDLDPDFSPLPHDSKGGAKGFPSGDEAARLDLLATEAALQVAGTIGMILAASTFVIFAVPVSAMLEAAGEPGGLFSGPGWRFRRWAGRMAVILTLAVVATWTSWGLTRRQPWSWWALAFLATPPPLAVLAGLVLKTWAAREEGRELGDVMSLPCVGVVAFAASLEVCRVAWSRRVRTVLGPGYEELVARTPKLRPSLRMGVPAGLGLVMAMLVLYWTLMVLILGLLVAGGVIRSM